MPMQNPDVAGIFKKVADLVETVQDRGVPRRRAHLRRRTPADGDFGAMLAAGTLRVILGLVSGRTTASTRSCEAGGTRKGAWDLSPSAPSTRWRTFGC
jgi:hypothetical protein